MTARPCERCGQDHPGCTGHTKNGPRAGQPCARPCKPGETCNSHGGAAPQVARARARREQEAEAARQAATLGLPLDINPTDALLQEVQWTAGHVHWLRSKVQELDEQRTHIREGNEGDEAISLHPNHARHGLVWGTTKQVDKGSGSEPGVDTTESATPSIWYVLYGQERDRLIAVCSAALRAGVEERKVRLAESQGDLVVAVIRRILDGLYASLLAAGLTADQLADAWQSAITDVVPRELRAIAGGAA